jgi:RNA polymerase sigma factor (sigma-70 family)
MKAWAARKRFQAGTNMRAWTFIILRNLFLSQMRRARFRGEWDEHTANKLLAAPASQDRHIELADMQRALMHLPQPQREALILVGAGGFAYEEAAEICGCAVGTIKSRVARGRAALEQLLDQGQLPSRREHKTDPSTIDAPADHGRRGNCSVRNQDAGGRRPVACSYDRLWP